MADGDPLPQTDHVLRYCFASLYAGGKVTAANFTPRGRDKGKLSTVWIECPHVAAADRNFAGGCAQLLKQITKNRSDDEIVQISVPDIAVIKCHAGNLVTREDWGKSLNKRHTTIQSLFQLDDQSAADFQACADLAKIARDSTVRRSIK